MGAAAMVELTAAATASTDTAAIGSPAAVAVDSFVAANGAAALIVAAEVEAGCSTAVYTSVAAAGAAALMRAVEVGREADCCLKWKQWLMTRIRIVAVATSAAVALRPCMTKFGRSSVPRCY